MAFVLETGIRMYRKLILTNISQVKLLRCLLLSDIGGNQGGTGRADLPLFLIGNNGDDCNKDLPFFLLGMVYVINNDINKRRLIFLLVGGGIWGSSGTFPWILLPRIVGHVANMCLCDSTSFKDKQ